MADKEAIQFLLSNLGQLIEYHLDLIAKSSTEVKNLRKDLESFNNFLKYASTRKLKDDRERGLVREICNAVYDAEDVVDAFVTQKSSAKSKGWFSMKLGNPVTIDKIAQRVQIVKDRLMKFQGKIDEAAEIGDDLNEIHANEVERPARERNVFGLEKDSEEIIKYLQEDTPHPHDLDIITIIGMAGLGKSTLAWNIFQASTVKNMFPAKRLLWVPVSKLTTKDVFLRILGESITEDVRNMKEEELAAKVRGFLEKEKFLIVMDGVWSYEGWGNISAGLPTTSHQGKILITTRNEEVLRADNIKRPPHRLEVLGLDDSVKLLQCQVFGKPSWEPDFEPHGKQIAEKCMRLPLAIVVAGGIIKSKLVSKKDHRAKVVAWKRFSERVGEYLLDDPEGTVERVLSLSYDRLPYHLRPCFLYFGMFPRDAEIPTWNLFQMWIAEGFIPKSKTSSLEETAENCLEELVSRNLVAVGRVSSDGKVKTCRIHDPLRNFCKKQAGMENDNFLEEIRISRDGDLEPLVTNDVTFRRLYVHSNIISRFVASKPSGGGVRSFVCFSEEGETLKKKHISTIPGAFKVLRVLDVKPAKFSQVPTRMYELLHLRYIHLSFNSKVLPRDFSKLWNIQTLIVETSERTLEIKADIWEMRHLRHVKTNAITTLPKPKTNSAAEDGNSIIQTLGTISPESCTDKILGAARNLRRVSIRGKLKTLLISGRKGGSFDNMVNLTKLEKLKLQNDVSPLQPSEDALPSLPPFRKFPPSLKILTLSRTFLDWSQMEVLGSLENLEVLRLKEEAFTGNRWETADEGFPSLEVLFIESPKLKVWKMSADIFPHIMQLVLRNCNDLERVPIEFAQRQSLRMLKLNHCPLAAAASAMEIKMKKMQADATVGFDVNIFPTNN